jgi:hypothetical protein
LLDPRQEQGRAFSFGDKAVGTGESLVGHLIRRNHNDGHQRLDSFHLLSYDAAVHSRHYIVEEHEVYGVRRKNLQGAFSIGCAQDLIAFAL